MEAADGWSGFRGGWRVGVSRQWRCRVPRLIDKGRAANHPEGCRRRRRRSHRPPRSSPLLHVVCMRTYNTSAKYAQFSQTNGKATSPTYPSIPLPFTTIAQYYSHGSLPPAQLSFGVCCGGHCGDGLCCINTCSNGVSHF